MSNEATLPAKQADRSSSVATPLPVQSAGNLLTRKDYGMHVTGMIDSITPVTHRQGTTAAGKPWQFYQQTITLALGGDQVEVAFRSDTPPTGPLFVCELEDRVKIKVEKPRVFNGKVSFDAVQD